MSSNLNSHDFCIRELQKNDLVHKLSLGKKEYLPLKTFLKRDAIDFHIHNIAKTYVLVEQNSTPHVQGYISLMCSELMVEGLQRPTEAQSAQRYRFFPAIKLARLAIDKSLQGRGFGQRLVYTAMGIVKDSIMPNVGCRFFTVDSKPDAITFYQKIGFSLLADEENKKNTNPLMLLDMNKIN